ncbi:MAG: hypothetical protein K0S04_2 [Herbinix sp.]|jgi:hypothetical protein|nr:hypothetical protein [Herbinix sp.]
MSDSKNKKSNNKKSNKGKQIIPILFFMLIGAVCGVLIAKYILNVDTESEEIPINTILIKGALLLLGMYVAIFLQIIIHEAGHLLFGLMTSYRFSSFRVGSFMWLKENDRIKFCRLSLAGTGGQCLLIPPEMKEGNYRYVLYNLGGSILNLISTLLFGAAALIFKNIGLLSLILMMLALLGVAFGLMNGIPMRLGMVNNDGYNTLALGKNREALRSFWIQMKVNEQQASGIRLKDMPDEWFVVPSEEAMENSITASIGVLACSRLMDQMKFSEAEPLIEELLNMNTGIVGLHRNLLVVDQIYCELVGENRGDILEHFLDKEQKKFMKVMKKFPSVLRTEYVYALLSKRDDALVDKIKSDFDKISKNYPYPSEILSERGLIRYAESLR